MVSDITTETVLWDYVQFSIEWQLYLLAGIGLSQGHSVEYDIYCWELATAYSTGKSKNIYHGQIG